MAKSRSGKGGIGKLGEPSLALKTLSKSARIRQYCKCTGSFFNYPRHCEVGNLLIRTGNFDLKYTHVGPGGEKP